MIVALSLILVTGCVDTDTKTFDTAPNVEASTPSLDVEELHKHLEALQGIADDNSNNRAVGTPGGLETREYIVQTLSDLGYDVWREPFTLSFFQNNDDPLVEANTERYTAAAFVYSASGDVEAPISLIDAQIPPASNPNSSTSGCEPADFDGFETGSIALIQRGTCTFTTKVQHAQDAGASAVIIFNEGQSGRTGVVEGMLDESGSQIPVVGVGYQTGVALSESEVTVRVMVDATINRIETENIFATKSREEDVPFVLVGAHLDSVVAGPGINDNGSGSAMLLAMAEWMQENPTVTEHGIRFAWWSAEEIGLLGSTYHVENTDNLDKVLYYLNYDMVASPNYVRFIYDGDGSQFGLEGPSGSDVIESAFEEHFTMAGLDFTGTPFDGRSDYGPFVEAGIPSGGLFTGAEATMTDELAVRFGGQVGEAFDPCYHQACDTIENVNQQSLVEMGNASLNVTLRLAGVTGTSVDSTRQAVSFGMPPSLPQRFDHQGEWLRR